ncbi:tRNA pseudouridine(55) synthase TruB [Amorphus sp. 3PC139-8]
MSDLSTEPNASETNATEAEPAKRGKPQRRKRDITGWLILDKPVGLTSTEALGAVKRLFRPQKAGHAGTLDPLASGLLPIAFGEATKTVPYVVDGRKVYSFVVKWGVETDTDDAEGEIAATSDIRPDEAAIRTILSDFTGEIEQVPPRYSAIKIAGERAYDLARAGEEVELQARTIRVYDLRLVDRPSADEAVFEAECGKGTYVRALARDMGRALGTCGHVSRLRRLAVGPFAEEDMITLDALREIAEEEDGAAKLDDCLLPVEEALDDLPLVTVTGSDAGRLRRGQAVILKGRDAPVFAGEAYAMAAGRLVALGEVERGTFNPKRVFRHSEPRR